ncbi:MAG: alpha-L-fucosidase, partial [Planctomycetota bacterium]
MTLKRTVPVALLASMMLVGAAALPPACGQDIPPLEKRSEWFRQARFGLFIHWGVYSMIGRGEWIQDTGKIPLAEYEKLNPGFNPVKYNADEWVALAKQAGQKYLVVTTKHHDGFCMLDSKLTDYDIMSTPLKRDVIKELADACHRQGLHLGFYYSIMDWHHPDYVPRRPWEKDRSTEGADFDRYVKYMRGQVREILTNYGQIDVLWFDGGWERKKPEDLQEFRDIIGMARKLQPQMLVNDRANIGGDFETPEQFIPATGVMSKEGKPVLWEACMTMTTGHGSFAPTAWWGYDKNEKVFKPTEELVHKLIDVVSKGGNFLLNIGPQPDGQIRPEEAERLRGVGRWMDRYGEAIHGTTASPFRLLPFFGRVTQKGNRLFVHVFDWPEDGQLMLPGLKSKVVAAAVMGDPGRAVGHVRSAGGKNVLLKLTGEAPDPVASVIVLELVGTPQVEPVKIEPSPDGAVELP